MNGAGFSRAQLRAIERSRAQRARELAPIHARIDDAIATVGWSRARPIVAAVLGHATGGQNGSWRHKVGKRNAPRLLAALDRLPVQGVLFNDATQAPSDG